MKAVNRLSSKLKDSLRYLKHGDLKACQEVLREARIRRHFPNVALNKPFQRTNIYVLTGSNRLDMMLWMMASWILATERHWPFVIIDDGTLLPSQNDWLQSHIPDCEILTGPAMDAQANQGLADYPKCLIYRNKHPLGRKLFDVALHGGSKRFLSLDTDLLFFDCPEILLSWAEDSESGVWFMKDVSDSCVIDRNYAKEQLGTTILKDSNTGIIAMIRSLLSIALAEQIFDQTDLLSQDPWFLAQSPYTLIGSRSDRCGILPKNYLVSIEGRASPADLVARHYVGAVRHRFYSEGIPFLNRHFVN
jgi:hypothetical protein